MRKNIIISLAVVALGSILVAQNSRMGSASSTQLLVVPSAKHLSGGGAVANAQGMDAVFWNPAGLAASENSIDAIFSNRQYIADITNNFFGVASTFGEYKIGINVRTFNIGEINETTSYFPDGTGQVFTPNFSILGTTLAKSLTENTSIGLNVNLIREGFGRVSASGVSYDFGVQHKGIAGLDDLQVGFALKNFGQPLKYDGEGLGVFATADDSDRPTTYYKVDAAAFDLPFVFDMGMKYSIAGADIGVTYTSNYYSTDELKLFLGYSFEGIGSLGVGIQSSSAAQEIEGEDDWYTNPSDGVSFGASIDMSRFVGTNMSVDYSMVPMGDFGTNSIVALRLAF